MTDLTTQQQVVQGVIREMDAHYVFPEMAKQVAQQISERLASHEYDALYEDDKFAEKLTGDLQAITKDKHVRVLYSPTVLPERKDNKPTAEEQLQYHKRIEAINFGVERVERLPFNIGYIELRGFVELALAGDKIAAAMTLIAHTDVLIVDLRRNGGGDPGTVAFMSSYLFDERTHLNSFFYRDSDRMDQSWTQDWVPGKRFGQAKPVYVLTSHTTFSGAEEFSYNLKNLKRATIVGETTGGGAHPGDVYRLSEHFSMFVPSGRAINPITHTNWEGVGVEPDVKVSADDALRIAQLLTLKNLVEKETDATRSQLMHERINELEKAAPYDKP